MKPLVFHDQPPLFFGGSLLLLLQGIKPCVDCFLESESLLTFFSALWDVDTSGVFAFVSLTGEALHSPTSPCFLVLMGEIPVSASLEIFAFETVRYCSIFSLGEVAGFNWRRDRLRVGEVSDICGDRRGGLSLSPSCVCWSPADATGTVTSIGCPMSLDGIRFISLSAILVGDLEICIREVVILWRPKGRPGWPRLALGSLESDKWGIWNVGSSEVECFGEDLEDLSFSRNWKFGFGTLRGVTLLLTLADDFETEADDCEFTISFQSLGRLIIWWSSSTAPDLLLTVTVTIGVQSAVLLLCEVAWLFAGILTMSDNDFFLGRLWRLRAGRRGDEVFFIWIPLTVFSNFSFDFSNLPSTNLLNPDWNSSRCLPSPVTCLSTTGDSDSLWPALTSWPPPVTILVTLVVVEVVDVSIVLGTELTKFGRTVATSPGLFAMGPTTCIGLTPPTEAGTDECFISRFLGRIFRKRAWSADIVFDMMGIALPWGLLASLPLFCNSWVPRLESGCCVGCWVCEVAVALGMLRMGEPPTEPGAMAMMGPMTRPPEYG